MSDELFDFGSAPFKSEAEKKAEKDAARREANLAAQQAYENRKKRQKEKREEAAEAIQKAANAAVEEKADATHIWFGVVTGNIRNETKAITGGSLPVGSYVRLEPVMRHLLATARAHGMVSNGSLNIQKALKAVAIRLTKSQAAKAKLSYLDKQVVVEDPDGSEWKKINSLLAKLKAKSDLTFEQDTRKAIIAHLNVIAKA